MTTLGIDLGGTTYSIGWLDGGGGFGPVQTFDTGAHRPRDAVLEGLVRHALDALDTARSQGLAIRAVGVGVPGSVNVQSGQLRVVPNLGEGWSGFALGPALEVRLGLPVFLLNDARAFTLAEATLGAARGKRDVLGITLGTGVGGGLVLGGRLYLGAHGMAGEFGHQVVDPHGPLCGCGGRGCLEGYTAGPALVAAAARPFVLGLSPMLRELCGGHLDALTPRLLALAAEHGDRVSLEVLARAGEALGVAVANATSLLGPEVVVVGGGVSEAGDFILEPLRRTLHQHAQICDGRYPEVIRAALGGAAGLIGAAVWAAQPEHKRELAISE